MTIIELKASGAVTLPKPVMAKLAHVRFCRVTETRKGVLLAPVDIQPAERVPSLPKS